VAAKAETVVERNSVEGGGAGLALGPPAYDPGGTGSGKGQARGRFLRQVGLMMNWLQRRSSIIGKRLLVSVVAATALAGCVCMEAFHRNPLT
jgi:hypothetical protein